VLPVIVTKLELLYVKATFETTSRVLEVTTLPPLNPLTANKVVEPNIPFTVPLPEVNPPTTEFAVVTALAEIIEAI
jgi:hypothetical protein